MDLKQTRITRTLLGTAGALALIGAVVVSPVGATGAKKVQKCQGKEATIVSNAKKIKGTNKADVIVAKSRGSLIDGKSGPDLICAGGNADFVNGGGGGDRVYGEGGDDILLGGPGKDKIYGGGGNDAMAGQGGHDLCQGGPGHKDLAQKKNCERIKSATGV